MNVSTPDQIGPYHVRGTLGRGGMGVVYRAEDERLGREVALKVLPDGITDARARDRLLAEARAAARLDHPHICTVYEVGEDQGRVYLALACYEGETLQERLSRGPLSTSEAVALGRQLASGLGAAHTQGIVHRDLKPSNVFLCEGDTLAAKILDFGIAKVEGVDPTQTSSTYGTLLYAAPEQAHGQADARADLWSLGVVLYEALSGRRPFDGAYEAAALYAVLHEDPAPLPDAVPAGLAAVVGRLLEKDPEARYQTADEVEADLAEAVGERPAVRSARPASPWRRWVAGGVLGAVAIAAGVVGLRVASDDPVPAGPTEIHLAVLPFTSAGADPESEAFASGLVETLVSDLTQLDVPGAYWVVPMSEVRTLGVTSASEALSALGATFVVTGSVQRDSARVRIPLSLVNATTQRQVSSRTVEAPLGELSTLQSEAISALAEMLTLEAGSLVRRTPSLAGTQSPEAYDEYLRGVGYLESSDQANASEEAIAALQRAIEADSRFALAHARLSAACLRRYGETREAEWVERAEVSSERALELSDDLALAHVTRSAVFAAKGELDLAEASARRALELDPNSHDALRALASAYEQKGEPDLAAAAYESAIRARPTVWLGYNDLGSLRLRQGAFDAAAVAFQEVIRLAPRNYHGYHNLGATFLYQEEYVQAREMLERAMDLQPTYSGYSNLAVAHVMQGEFEEAAETYRRALTIDDSDHTVWGNLGDALRQLPGQETASRTAYQNASRRAETAIRLNDQDVSLWTSLALYAVGLGDNERAIGAIERALRLQPPTPETSVYAASVFVRVGNEAEALRWVGRALGSGYPRAWIESDADLAPLLDQLPETPSAGT